MADHEIVRSNPDSDLLVIITVINHHSCDAAMRRWHCQGSRGGGASAANRGRCSDIACAAAASAAAGQMYALLVGMSPT